jgi:type II protein arginine methyltransferase
METIRAGKVLTPAARAALARSAQGDPLVQIRLALSFAWAGHRRDAYELAKAACAAAPLDREIDRIAAEAFSLCIPAWYFPAARDNARSAAYDAAIRRAVRPGMRVLEIGTGTGLFAMMAARAGAADVVTCESDPRVADVARDVISRNGYSDRIRVIARNSTELDADADLGGPADLLISEIISVHMLDEARRQVIRHAAESLLRPGAQLIPARATALAALAEDPEADYHRMDAAAGFDLTPFNRFAAPRYIASDGARDAILRSSPAALMVQRMAQDIPAAEGSAVLTSTGGRVDGIAQWVMLDLDEATRYENRHGTPAGRGWWPAFFPFDRPREFAAGTQLRVHARQDGGRLRVWTDDA